MGACGSRVTVFIAVSDERTAGITISLCFLLKRRIIYGSIII